MLSNYRTLLRFSKFSRPSVALRFFNSNFNGRFNTSNSNESEESNSEQSKLSSSALLSSTLLGFGLMYYVNKSKDDFFPQVCAKSRGNTRRDLFNPIADTVEECAGALVHIEIIDNRRVDLFTGQYMTQTNGSGFIVQDDGLIITNAHVVMSRRSNSRLKITLYDGSVYDGVVEDVDMKADLATIRISAGKKLPTMRLGTSHDVRSGEWVIAMGSPLSLANTITCGVVSTVNRSSEDLKLHGKDMQYLQTDAMITFGNSGGPLVNLNGEVIGINVMKVSTGISFAIPIEYAKEFLKISAEKKKAGRRTSTEGTRKFIGITMLSLNPELIRELQHRKEVIPPGIDSGVLVWKVMIGSPAFIAGLQPGDIVTEVNGHKIEGASTIYKILETAERLYMTVYRQKQKLNITLSPEIFT